MSINKKQNIKTRCWIKKNQFFWRLEIFTKIYIDFHMY